MKTTTQELLKRLRLILDRAEEALEAAPEAAEPLFETALKAADQVLTNVVVTTLCEVDEDLCPLCLCVHHDSGCDE